MCPFASSEFTSTFPVSAACNPLRSPLSAARHNASEGLDAAATGAEAGVGTGWVTAGVGTGWVTACGGGGAADATLIAAGGTEVLDAAGAGGAAGVAVSARSRIIGALCGVAVLCHATLTAVGDWA